MVQSRYSLPSTSVTRHPIGADVVRRTDGVGGAVQRLDPLASGRGAGRKNGRRAIAPVGVVVLGSDLGLAGFLGLLLGDGGRVVRKLSAVADGAGGGARPSRLARRSGGMAWCENEVRSVRRRQPRRSLALDEVHHLDRHRAQQRELAGVRRRAERERPQRAHDVLGIARLEELDRGERVARRRRRTARTVRIGRRRRVLPRRRDRSRRVGRRQVQLVERDQRRLREVERRVIRSSEWSPSRGRDRARRSEDRCPRARRRSRRDRRTRRRAARAPPRAARRGGSSPTGAGR